MDIRTIEIIPNYTKYAEGSALIKWGDTIVLCTASVEDKVPAHKKDTGQGWITAEYSMLPRAVKFRKARDISSLKLNGRSGEIQRLIGRALRSVVNLKELGERTITIDCDVLQADGGTRCASITGGFVAMYLAFARLVRQGIIKKIPAGGFVCAVSCGIDENGAAMLDLDYKRDCSAICDVNFVFDTLGRIIEIQGTGEKRPFTEQEFAELLSLAKQSLPVIIKAQQDALDKAFV